MRNWGVRYTPVPRQQPPIAVPELLVRLNPLTHVAGSAKQLQIANLIAAPSTEWIFVVNLKVADSVKPPAIRALAFLTHKELILHTPGKNTSASLPVARIVVPSHLIGPPLNLGSFWASFHELLGGGFRTPFLPERFASGFR